MQKYKIKLSEQHHRTLQMEDITTTTTSESGHFKVRGECRKKERALVPLSVLLYVVECF